MHIHQIANQLSTRSDSLNQMRITSQEEDELALLKHTITHGWPSTIREVPSKIQLYWTFREELTVEDGIILKGTQIVIHHKKHQAILQLIHEEHFPPFLLAVKKSVGRNNPPFLLADLLTVSKSASRFGCSQEIFSNQ